MTDKVCAFHFNGDTFDIITGLHNFSPFYRVKCVGLKKLIFRCNSHEMTTCKWSVIEVAGLLAMLAVVLCICKTNLKQGNLQTFSIY